jgi:hypothetical protein
MADGARSENGRDSRDCPTCSGVRSALPRAARGCARLPLRHHREREADHVDPLVEQLAGHLRGEPRVAEHHRDDRVRSLLDREAPPPSSPSRNCAALAISLSRSAVLPPMRSRTAIDAPTMAGRERVREQVRARALPQQVDHLARPLVKPPAAPPSALPSVDVMTSTRPMTPQCSGVPRPVLPTKPGRVAVVDHHQRVVLLGEVADAIELAM